MAKTLQKVDPAQMPKQRKRKGPAPDAPLDSGKTQPVAPSGAAESAPPERPSLARRAWGSLRFRMLSMAGTLLLIVLALLVYNSVRLSEQYLLDSGRQRLQDFELAITASMSSPLSRRQYAGMNVLAGQLKQGLRLSYVVVVDPEQQVITLQGWDESVPLPARTNDLSELPRGADQYHGIVTLREGQRALGYILFGMPTESLRKARADLMWQSIAIGGTAFVLIMMVLAVIAWWVTRELRALERGVSALEQGQSQVKLPVRGFGEIGALTRAFNAMSQRLEERVEALRRSEARFHAIADYTYGVEAWFNPRGKLIWVNRSIERVAGYTSLECILAEDLAQMLVHPKDRKHAAEEAARAQQGTSGENVELRLIRKDGTLVWVAVNWQPIFGTDGEYLGLRVSANEIQSRKEAELKLLETVAELRRAQALKDYYLNRSDEERRRLEALLNVMKVGVLFVDNDRRILFCNKVLMRIWDIDENEVLTGVRDDAVMDRTAVKRADDAGFRRHINDVLKQKTTSPPYETLFKDGRTIADISALVPGSEPGRFIGRVWIYEDVTEQKRIAERLTHLAERDPLTNLYNRRRFNEELDRMLADAGRRRSQLGLLVMDLDEFKPVNDRFGHKAGDEVLVMLAASVGRTVRRNEMLFRLGGDEFAILAPDSSESDMVGLARRVGVRISELRFRFGEQEFGLTASLGVAVYPAHAISGEEIIARADYAMYQAKAGGRNQCQVYQEPPEP